MMWKMKTWKATAHSTSSLGNCEASNMKLSSDRGGQGGQENPRDRMVSADEVSWEEHNKTIRRYRTHSRTGTYLIYCGYYPLTRWDANCSICCKWPVHFAKFGFQDAFGDTALHRAAAFGHTEVLGSKCPVCRAVPVVLQICFAVLPAIWVEKPWLTPSGEVSAHEMTYLQLYSCNLNRWLQGQCNTLMKFPARPKDVRMKRQRTKPSLGDKFKIPILGSHGCPPNIPW